MSASSSVLASAVTYVVAQSKGAWTVYENSEPVSSHATKAESVETAVVLTLAAKAVGRTAQLLAPAVDGTVEVVDVNKPLASLQRYTGHD